MSGEIYEIEPKNKTSLVEFSDLLHKSGLLEKFDFRQLPVPVLYFRNEFLEYIAQHGLFSLYHFSTAVEDVTSPSMKINEIEKVIAKFLSHLDGAKRIVIIDPYFYRKSKTVDVPAIFKSLLFGFSSVLEEIVFVTNGRKNETGVEMHAAVKALRAGATIKEFVTEEFHDRYWIDPDKNTGIVMGTSLNGLGSKIALIDKLRDDDVAEIIRLAKALGAPL
ncbi:hypothetical protein AWB68_05783 [Caballeronia choica]|uniref:Uncharacterized protein n=1 Tax=Caballeronia choica TaxID=326476 RepID=A0A158KG47_9BURK|nr:hypothetical protein [Caballeronia choica]SAL80102.1 hypothetical protein AWB68_05783 [Caballeronia choica]